MKKTCNKDVILTNIRRAGGQVQGVEKMIEEDRDVAEILQQISAASSALRSVGRTVLEDYANGCFTKGSKHTEKDLQKLITYLFKNANGRW